MQNVLNKKSCSGSPVNLFRAVTSMKNKLGGGKPCNAGLWQLSVGYQGAQYFLSLSSVQGFHWPSPESPVQHLQFQAEMSTVSLLLCQIFAHFHFVSSSLFVCVCIAKHLSCFPNDMALQSGLIPYIWLKIGIYCTCKLSTVYTCQAKKKARLGIAISNRKVHLLVQVPKEKQTFEKFTDANKFASIANQRIWPKSAFLTWQTLLCSIEYLVVRWLSRSEGRRQRLSLTNSSNG